MTLRPINILALLILTACSVQHPQIPSVYAECDTVPAMYPDYKDVVIPVNIAPLNFKVTDEQVEECIAEISCPDFSMTYGFGNKVIIDEKEWGELIEKSVGNELSIQLYTKVDQKWTRHPSFNIQVVPDSIDPYIIYRRIPPSYSTYEYLSLNERCVENFKEKEIYNNQMLDKTTEGHCINCHSFQDFRTQRMQFHVRAEFAGTVIYDNGKLEKVNTSSPQTIAPAVYPAWHPTMDIIAYSVNKSFQNFHTSYHGKVEVQDSEADLMLYDVANHKVIPICNETDELAAFPTWSPDGKWLYYSSAHLEYQDSVAISMADNARIARQHEAIARYKEVEYDIYRRSFDAETLSFGEAEKVIPASENGMSATVPRISSDGKYMLTSMGDYGCFHIWHPESDLYVTDLDSLKTEPLTAANSSRSEGFHCWSSNGRWILFASRRYDSNYSRLYFAYFDREGVAHKAFELPQEDPDYELLNLRSYNVPEFLIEPVRVQSADLARVIGKEAL